MHTRQLVTSTGATGPARPGWLAPHAVTRRPAGAAGGWRAACCLPWILFFSCAYGQQANPGPVTLGWNASTGPAVAGYYVYYGGATGYYTNKSNAGTNTTFAVSGLVAGYTYYFTATAYNAAGTESCFASEVAFQVPGPGLAGGLSASAITYGQPLSAATISGTVTNTSGVAIPGTFVYTSPAVVLAAGTYSETAIFVPTGTNNFAMITGSVSVSVQAAPLTITAGNLGKIYGQTVGFGGGSTLFTASGLQNGDTVGTVTLVDGSNGGVATAPVAGSPYLLTPGAVTGGTFATGNYVITYVAGRLTVSPALLTVTANSQSRGYGTANPVLTASYSGFLNGDTVAVISGAPGLSTSATTSSPVGTYAITTAPGTLSAANYGFATGNGTLSVTQASLIITALNESKTFGQTVGFTNGSTLFASAGLRNGETIGTVSLAVNNNGGAAAAPVAGSPYTITPSAATGGTFIAGNYAITYAPGTLTVNPAPLVITAVNQSKTYGQTVAFGSGSTFFSASGLQNGDSVGTVTLTVTNNGGSAAAPVSGSPYTTTPGAATGGTLVAGNYAITYVPGVLTVNPAPLTITAANQGKTYGQTMGFGSGSTQFTASGLQNGQTIGSVTLADPNSGGAATATVAGSPYPLTPGGATGGSFAAGNYAITYVAGNLTVNAATLTITAANESKIYGQTAVFGSGSTLFSASGLQNGETIGTVTLVDASNGGAATAPVAGSPYPLTPRAATGGTFVAGNYTLAYVNGNLAVTPAPATVTAANQSKTYGQAMAFGGGSSLFTATGLQNGETIGTVTLADPYNGGAATATVAGSTYPLTPSAATGGTFTAGNYTLTYVNGRLAVTPAALTITALNQSKTYGQAATFGSGGTLFTASGLQNGDVISTVTLLASSNGGWATAPVAGSPYTITAGSPTGASFTAGNYAITYVPGTLTVNPAPLTITTVNQHKTYGQTMGFGTGNKSFTSSGLLNGQTINSVTMADPNSGGAATATVAGSPYPLVPGTATGGSFAAGNYTITYVPGALTVNPAALTVTAANQTKSYGQTVGFGSVSNLFTVNGLQNGETVGTVTLADPNSGGAATAAVAGSPYPITPGAATGGTFIAGNYTLAYVNGTLTVNPTALTVTAVNESKTYGQTLVFTNGNSMFTAAGLQNGETIGTVTLADPNNGGVATAAVAATYPLTPSAATGGTFAAGNYTLAYVNGRLTVNPAALTITALNQSKTYGQTLPFGSGGTLFTASGLQNGEVIGTVTLAASSNGGAATASVAGSPYTITPGSPTGGTFATGNYAITYVPGILTVNPAPLTITEANQSKTYGQTVGFGSGNKAFTSSGLVNGQTIGSVTVADPNGGGAATATVAGSPYPLTPSAATGGSFAIGNYSITYLPGTLTVNPALLTVTAVNESKTYGQTMVFTNGSSLFTAAGLQNGETMGTVTLGDPANGGGPTAAVAGSPYPITPSAAIGGTFAARNYTLAYVNGSLTVNPAPLTVTAVNESKTYGQTVVFTNGSSLFTATGLQNGETIGTVTLGDPANGGAATATVAGSTYPIAPSAATGGTFAPGNYTLAYIDGRLTVSPAALTITALNQSKTYGQTVTFGSGSTLFTASGLQNGEGIGTVTLSVSFNGGSATAAVAGSPYKITPGAPMGGTCTPGNYAITYVPGTLTVSPAPVTITELNQSKTYGQALVFGGGNKSFTTSGLLNGDTISLVTVADANNGGAATAPVAGSPYPLAPSAATGGTFAASNYAITYLPGTLTVNPAPLTITVVNQSKTYGQTVAFGSGSALFSSSGLKNGETIGSVTLTDPNNGGAPTATVAGSPYTLAPSAATGGTFAAGNYTLAYVNGTLAVNPAALTVAAVNQTKTYGQTVVFTNGSTWFTNTGLQNGETIGSVTLAVANNGGAATATVAGSTYTITPSAATGGTFAAGNYTLVYVTGKLTVSRAALTITALNQTKVFGQTLVFGSGSTLFSASGLQNSETVGTVTLAVSNNGGAASATVGGSPYTITPSAATGGTFAAGNYTLAYVTGTLTVTPVSMLVKLGTIVTTTPVTIHNPVLLGDGTIQLTFTGGRAGMAYQVEGSSDCQNWITLTNMVAGANGLAAFIDTGATKHALRFYRTVAP